MPPVARLLLNRLWTSVLVLFGVSILIFCIARVIPGDPARIALGPNATAEQIHQLRETLRLNEPLPVQYVAFLGDLTEGDLGLSLYTNRPVTEDIAQFLPATLELITLAAVLMVVIGLPLGAIAAHYRDRWVDHLVRALAMLGVSAPGFVWAIVFMLAFAYFVPIFPIAGRISEGFDIPTVTGFLTIDSLLAGNVTAAADALHHLFLPALALAMSGVGQTARLTRANMVETYHRPYVEMAEAYGFPPHRIASRYAFRPALIPSLTILGLDIAAMLGNAFLVEAVYAWPGLSRYGVHVILRKDLNAIVGTVLVISALFLIINILVDVLVSLINPRIRLAEKRR